MAREVSLQEVEKGVRKTKAAAQKIYPQGDMFGERLRSLRIANGLSQDEFAEKLGYETGTSISQIENGEVLPDTAALNCINETCPVDLHYMITGKAGLCVGLDIELLRPHVLKCINSIIGKMSDLEMEKFMLEVDQQVKHEDNCGAVTEIAGRIDRLRDSLYAMEWRFHTLQVSTSLEDQASKDTYIDRALGLLAGMADEEKWFLSFALKVRNGEIVAEDGKWHSIGQDGSKSLIA